MSVNQAFGKALQRVRSHRQLSQEDFSDVSSRTYISTLERGLKSPTLDKIDSIARKLRVHPLTLLTLCYAGSGERERDRILRAVETEMRQFT